jgi:DtxR family transcriptional regulator, Mn-dependent transcriptional regulator
MSNEPKETPQESIRTKAVDDFLKAVYFLQTQVGPAEPVPTTLLAQQLNISAASVTDMVKRLSGVDDDKDKKHKHDDTSALIPLLDYKPYYGVRLSAAGERIALEVIRHHRLLELYLVTALGYSWDEVHEEAERLEHHISEKLEARISAALGNPKIDPHGDPIPALDGTIGQRVQENLADLTLNQPRVVSQIVDQRPDVLRYLSELGLTPGAEIVLTVRSPLNDTVSVLVDGSTHTISTQMARKVLVSPE